MRSFIFLFLLLISLRLSAQNNFTIPVWSIDNGVTKSESSTFTLSATVGQPESGKVVLGSSYKLSGGFWFQRADKDVCMVPIIMYLLD